VVGRKVCEGGEDELAEYYADVPPEDRPREAMLRLFVAARRQLSVKNPNDVASDEAIDLVLRGRPLKGYRFRTSKRLGTGLIW